MAGSSRRRTPEQVDNQVKVRQIRQQRLTDDDHPLDLVAIVDEAALHRVIGSQGIMRAQVTHLQLIGELERVTLQVLPFGAGRHEAMTGAFTVLEFPEVDDPELLYVSHVTGTLHIERTDDVHAAKLVHEQLRTQALPPDESAALLERLAQQ